MSRRNRFPLRVENLLTEAGGSAYAWYEDELEQYLDSEGQTRRRSDAIEVAAFISGLVVATYCVAASTGHAVLVPALSMAYLFANFGFGRGWFPAPWRMTLALSAIFFGVTGGTTSSGALVAVAALLFGGLIARNVMDAYRSPVFAVYLTVGSVVGSAGAFFVGPGWVAGLSGLAAGAIASSVAAYFLQGKRQMGLMPVSLRPEQYSWTLPDPPTRLPFLLRRRARRFEEEAAAERKTGSRGQREAAIDIKKIGGAGERKTGLLLLGLKRGRWTRIVHDVGIPGASRGGNADHVVLARSGAWVLDSKQFGSSRNPGVVRRTNTGEIVHVTGHNSRNLDQTLRTAAWAVRGISNELRLPVRALLVIHNAEVEEGLSILVPGPSPDDGDVRVDVLPARHLVAYLDSAAPIMSRWKVSTAHWALQSNLVSATTGRPPQLVAPLGGGPNVPTPMRVSGKPYDAQAVAAAHEGTADAMGPPVESGDPSPASADNQRHERPVSSPEEPEQVFPADPMHPGEGLEDMVNRRIRERWEQVRVSEPAAPDDVPDELRGVTRGVSVSYLGFNSDFTDVHSQDLVALSGPCQGIDGPFVWACSPAQWEAHQKTGDLVMASTVSLDGLALLPQEGTDAP